MSFNALRIGLTGLRANQQNLDVIGNNLTNAGTLGYKADRLTFADAFYRNLSSGSAPGGNVGGTNGLQTGLGVTLGGIDHLLRQGSIVQTGRPLDLALQGNGFFVLSDGQQSFYSRVGAFSLDSAGNLVNGTSGLKVQDIGGNDIQIDQDTVLPANPTQNAILSGNLPATRTGPLPEIQETNSAFQDFQPAILRSPAVAAPVNLAGLSMTVSIDGAAPQTLSFPGTLGPLTGAALATEITNSFANLTDPNALSVTFDTATNQLVFTTADSGPESSVEFAGPAASALGIDGASETGDGSTATGATLLNDLNANTTDYVTGDIIRITGFDTTGATVSDTFTFGDPTAGNDGTTLAELTAKIQTNFPGAVVQVVDGKIQIESNSSGESPLALELDDDSVNTGSSNFNIFEFGTSQAGTGPDERASTITVFDSLGAQHTLTGLFSRQDDGTWNLEFSIPEDEGTVTSGGLVTGINFNADGSFQGAGANSVEINWSNQASAQSIDVDFGETGGFTGLTQTANPGSAQFEDQDGFPSGTLVGVDVTGEGIIKGQFSNNERVDLATLAIARFRNPEGLVKEGGTMFRIGGNAGEAIIGGAQENGAASVVGRALEGSNVDTAEEFVRLIEAQRSFQSSSRLISTADELFVDLLQIV